MGGVTSSNHDLNNISNEDYTRTMMLMLIGITIILIILFRSIVMPLYLMASLLLTFYTSMAITEVIFVRLLGNSGISWAVPFFGFVMLVALGIDYSIFLMDRFREYRDLSPDQAILKAMKSMGGVIMSAAIILGRYFCSDAAFWGYVPAANRDTRIVRIVHVRAHYAAAVHSSHGPHVRQSQLLAVYE